MHRMHRRFLEEVERDWSAVEDVWHIAPRQQRLVWADVRSRSRARLVTDWAEVCQRLPPARLLAEMRKPYPKSGALDYGLGLSVQDSGQNCAGTIFHHNGSVLGYGALMYSTPDGSKTLTASLTGRDAAVDLMQEHPKALDKLLKEVLRGGQAGMADKAKPAQ
ncbi:hypothetical protein ITP53_29320 [Nonomuraea sp. K274]|uniref:Uncharacterized protein n=1 Tax=Nonomuraea cypriaca TaxID=1187855 RepID=A0A931AB87_9ACTN|nr:hypothetical protein [Nonomuraea cypriaca]MBF8189762.1 hypothetical protein [Nonomuraea cypriaca]